MKNDREFWQRVMLLGGWNVYNLGLDDPDIANLKKNIKKKPS